MESVVAARRAGGLSFGGGPAAPLTGTHSEELEEQEEEDTLQARTREKAGALEVRSRQWAVEEERRRSATETQAREVAEKRRRDAYSEARELDTAEAYRVFLSVYPNAPETPEARKHLDAIQADDQAFAQARASLQGLEGYLSTRPKGRHAAEARREEVEGEPEWKQGIAPEEMDWFGFEEPAPRDPKAVKNEIRGLLKERFGRGAKRMLQAVDQCGDSPEDLLELADRVEKYVHFFIDTGASGLIGRQIREIASDPSSG